MPSTRQIDDIWYVKYSIVQWSIKWYYKKDFYFQNFRPVYFVLKTNLYIVECFSNSFFSKLYNFILQGEKPHQTIWYQHTFFVRFNSKINITWKTTDKLLKYLDYELTKKKSSKTIPHHQNSFEICTFYIGRREGGK